MKIKPTPKQELQRQLIDEGTISAVCIDIVDRGFQKTNFEAKPGDLQFEGMKVVREVQLTFEVDQRLEGGPRGGERMVISRKFPVSDYENSHFVKFLKSWLKKDVDELLNDAGEFDLKVLCLGQPALLNIMHGVSKAKGNSYPKIEGISPLVKGMQPIKQEVLEIKQPQWLLDEINSQIPEDVLKEANPGMDF